MSLVAFKVLLGSTTVWIKYADSSYSVSINLADRMNKAYIMTQCRHYISPGRTAALLVEVTSIHMFIQFHPGETPTPGERSSRSQTGRFNSLWLSWLRRWWEKWGSACSLFLRLGIVQFRDCVGVVIANLAGLVMRLWEEPPAPLASLYSLWPPSCLFRPIWVGSRLREALTAPSPSWPVHMLI